MQYFSNYNSDLREGNLSRGKWGEVNEYTFYVSLSIFACQVTQRLKKWSG